MNRTSGMNSSSLTKSVFQDSLFASISREHGQTTDYKHDKHNKYSKIKFNKKKKLLHFRFATVCYVPYHAASSIDVIL